MNKYACNILGLALALAVTSTPATSQMLRRAIAAADLIAVARTVRVVPTKHHVLHRLKIQEVLRGPRQLAGIERITVVETKRVSAHNRPVAGKTMLVCLHDFSRGATKVGLPNTFAPFFKMSGHPGSAVVLDTDPSKDPRVAFARVLTASQKGGAPRQAAEQLFTIAIHGDARVRIEAAQSLTERSILAGYLTKLHLSKVLTRAVGETADIPYKIALATIAVERRESAVIPTLCVSVEHVADKAFLQALGRFSRFLHQDRAADALLPHVQRANGKTRARLLYALGATSTPGALKTLLAMHQSGQDRSAVEAALRIHGSPRATAAIAKKPVRAPK